MTILNQILTGEMERTLEFLEMVEHCCEKQISILIVVVGQMMFCFRHPTNSILAHKPIGHALNIALMMSS